PPTSRFPRLTGARTALSAQTGLQIMQTHPNVILSHNKDRLGSLPRSAIGLPLQTGIFRPTEPLIPVRYKLSTDLNDLKEDFLQSLDRCGTAITGLRVVVLCALEAGVSRA